MVWQGQLKDWESSQPATSSLCVHEVVWGLSLPDCRGWEFCAKARWVLLKLTSASPSLDTSFMYMIAGLCMLKLYQKRHPDINASAYSAYACLAIVIFFSVLGVVRPCPTLLAL